MMTSDKSKQPKSQSVTKQGGLDGFIPPMAYSPQVIDGGYTRIEISAPSSKLSFIHKKLLEVMQPPFKVRYVRMTDRLHGQLPKPESYVAVELSKERLIQVCSEYETLLYHDARHQFWIRGAAEEQLVLDELGMLYIYPDDFLFRETLSQYGWIAASHESMATRDYVKVYFDAQADQEEQSLMHSLGMIRWEG